jgi:outer membrane protein assembly complex protein YaeT
VAVAAVLLCGLIAWTQEPGVRPTVSDIVIQGNQKVPTENIRARLQTCVGREYNPKTVQDDMTRLWGTNQFLQVEARMAPDGPNKVKIYFIVRDQANKIKKVEYLGAKHIKDSDLNDLTHVAVGQPLNPQANRGACMEIIKKLNEDGRPLADCKLLRGGQPDDDEVIFQISEGPKVAIHSISFRGNTFVSSGRLNTVVKSSAQILGLPFGGNYNPQQVANDTGELLKYYHKFGFLAAQVEPHIEWTPDGSGIHLTFHIEEGDRFRIQNTPQVAGEIHACPREQLEAYSTVKPGSYFDEDAITLDKKKIEAWYGYRGQKVQVADFKVYDQNTPGIVNVQYQIQERPVDKVGEIQVIGNTRTRLNVILRQVPLFPGQPLTYPDLEVARSNLNRLGIFTPPNGQGPGPEVEVVDPLGSDSEYKKILIRLQEQNTGSLMFGVGVNSSSGLTGNIVLNERNFDILRPPTSIEDLLSGNAWRGAGQEFRVEAMPGTQFQRYTISFREPFLFDTPYSLMVSGYYFQRFYNEYTETRLGPRFTFGRRLNRFWSASLGGRIEDVGVHNVAANEPFDYQVAVGNHMIYGLRGEVTRDSRDSFLRATSGSLINIAYEEVTGYHTFPLINLDVSKYFTVGQRRDGSGKQVVAIHSQVGWAGNSTPVFERFFAGGFQTIRGFQFRGVGNFINGYNVGGNFLLLNSIEYQYPVLANDSVFLVGFVDSGTVAPTINDINTYRVSVGFGVRFSIPMLGPMPIALDFGFPVVKGPNDIQQIFNFWMGFYR